MPASERSAAGSGKLPSWVVTLNHFTRAETAAKPPCKARQYPHMEGSKRRVTRLLGCAHGPTEAGRHAFGPPLQSGAFGPPLQSGFCRESQNFRGRLSGMALGGQLRTEKARSRVFGSCFTNRGVRPFFGTLISEMSSWDTVSQAVCPKMELCREPKIYRGVKS